MIITLDENQIQTIPFASADGDAAFYQFLFTEITGKPWDECNDMDCSRINIAENIQTSWFRQYREISDKSNLDADTALAMFLVMYGPKVDKKLKDNTVELLDGWCSIVNH